MRAQDRQSDPTPLAGPQVELGGTDESTARSDVLPEADESTAPVGLLQKIKRGPGVFAAGFRGATWDHKADETIKDGLQMFDEIRSLSDVDERLKPRIEELLQSRRDFLRSEAAVRAIANRVTWVLCICAVVVPAVVVGLTTPLHQGALLLYISQLFGLALVATWPAVVLDTLTGRDRTGVIWLAFILWAYTVAAVLIVTMPGHSDPNDAIFVAAVCAATAFTIVLVARAYVVTWNETALVHGWAQQRLEAAVVWMLLGVIHALVEKPGKALVKEPGTPTRSVVQVLLGEPGKEPTPTLLQRSGTARALLARAAATVNDYLPRLIDGGRADAQSIASEGAAALLDLRSAVNLPGGRVREEDFARLTAAIEAWSIGSLADMPRTIPLLADFPEPASRRSGLLQVVRKLLLGVLPLILLIAVTLLPLKMSAAVTAALAPFAVTWLLLSIASVFAPADVKMDTKTLFGG